MQVINSALVVVLISCLSVPAVQAQEIRFKDGRTFHLELVRRLDLDLKTMSKVFADLRQSVPKQKNEADLIAGVNGLAKIAAQACTEAGYFEEVADIDDLYLKILDRAPSADEKSKAIKKEDGQPSFYANCFLLAMHPEFILLKRGGTR